MHCGLSDQVHEVHQHAQQPEHIRLVRLEVTIHGENDDHCVIYDHGRWTCACHLFAGWGSCAHTMAVEQLLGPLMMQTVMGVAHEPAVTIGLAIPVD